MQDAKHSDRPTGGKDPRRMNREEAKNEIRKRYKCADYLTKSKGGLYCCPFCGSGTGHNATGAVKVYEDSNTWHCFSCDQTGDVIDLYQQANGCDFNTALSQMAGQIGIEIDRSRADAAAHNAKEKENGRTARTGSGNAMGGGMIATPQEETPQRGAQRATEDAEPPNYAQYYVQCALRIEDPAPAAYLQRRGISTKTAARFLLGYDPAADPAAAPGAMGGEYKPHPCPRIIIPTDDPRNLKRKSHYVGRSIDTATPKAFAKINAAGSKPGIFNGRALYAQDVQEIFITEGAFDALSILEAGAEAIALNSTANAAALIKVLEERRTEATLIICLDNDEAGKKATAVLREGLQRLNISYITADICNGYKDPNEALIGNRAAFIEAVERAQRQTAARPDNTRYYIDALMGGEIDRFKRDKKTGFTNLDEKAGGLYSGLYVLAAISSLGKTSFALQLADQLAAGGEDVIFFSMEQSRLELVSKSLARRIAQKDAETAVTSLSIRKGCYPRQAGAAAEEYKAAIADRMSIVEGNFACNIAFIGEYIRRYIDRNKTRPVVFVDYLQILQPAEDRRQSTKEAIDSTVTELKRISRELDITVIVVSSVNRANYLTPIDFEALKESGGIEFTADVVWGLQLQCLNDPVFDSDKKIKEKRETVRRAKAENPRKIELLCLKNRYGLANYSCYFKYYPANDLFTEDTGAGSSLAAADQWADIKAI